jgi:hypothetical protein
MNAESYMIGSATAVGRIFDAHNGSSFQNTGVTKQTLPPGGAAVLVNVVF